MSRRIGTLTAAQVLLGVFLFTVAREFGRLGEIGPAVVPAAVAFALVGSFTMHIELRRHACAVTMIEAVLVASLFHLDPIEVVVGAALGEALACGLRRQPFLQLAFNVTAAAAATSVGVVVFGALPEAGPLDPAGAGVAFVAAACYGLASHTSTSAVLAIVEDRRFGQVFAASFAPSAAATIVSSSIGIIIVMQAAATGIGILAVVPLIVMMVLETRRVAAHRADHLRFKRLYAASARTGRLVTQFEAMATVADEARKLVTGAAAICCTTDRAGRWHGIIVADAGNRIASDSEVDAVVGLGTSAAAGELGGGDVPGDLGDLATPVESIVFAASGEGASVPVVVAVARQLAGGTNEARAEVLSAFVGHAVLTIANAALYAEVEDALAHQVDLNRQKDDFVAAVSHELRTPLTSMIGSVSSIRRLGDRLTPDKQAVLVDVALRQGARLKQLIEDLLLLSSIEGAPKVSREVGDVDVPAMAADIAADLSGPHGDAPPVPITFDASFLPPIRTDEGKLRQVLTNLVENARKYAPESPVDIRASVVGAAMVIDVIDHGPGITGDDRSRVFERFVQLDQSSTRARGGTGLGLYLCRQLAGVLGGSLELFDADGGGCRFTLTVPLTSPTIDHAAPDDGDYAALVVAASHGS